MVDPVSCWLIVIIWKWWWTTIEMAADGGNGSILWTMVASDRDGGSWSWWLLTMDYDYNKTAWSIIFLLRYSTIHHTDNNQFIYLPWWIAYQGSWFVMDAENTLYHPDVLHYTWHLLHFCPIMGDCGSLTSWLWLRSFVVIPYSCWVVKDRRCEALLQPWWDKLWFVNMSYTNGILLIVLTTGRGLKLGLSDQVTPAKTGTSMIVVVWETHGLWRTNRTAWYIIFLLRYSRITDNNPSINLPSIILQSVNQMKYDATTDQTNTLFQLHQP